MMTTIPKNKMLFLDRCQQTMKKDILLEIASLAASAHQVGMI
jgi:hypothetical protein